MPDYASIKIKTSTKKKADRLIKKFNYKGLDFYESMVVYFEQTGVNPRDLKVLSPAEELQKMNGKIDKTRDTTIAFFRKQESDYIKPTFGKMDYVIGRLIHYLEHEAPKREGEKVEVPGEKQEEGGQGIGSELELSKVKMELMEAREKLRYFKESTIKIFENSGFKSTGLNKKIVVEMSKVEFDKLGEEIKIM